MDPPQWRLAKNPFKKPTYPTELSPIKLFLLKGLALLAILFATACGTKPGTDASTDSGERIVPKAGNYMAEFTEFTADECNLRDSDLDETEADVQIWFSYDGAKLLATHVRNGNPREAVSCEMTGTNFSCASIYEEDNIDPFDATIGIDLSFRGDWISNTEIIGGSNIDITCTGSDCDEAIEGTGMPALPCTTIMGFFGEWTARDVPA